MMMPVVRDVPFLLVINKTINTNASIDHGYRGMEFILG